MLLEVDGDGVGAMEKNRVKNGFLRTTEANLKRRDASIMRDALESWENTLTMCPTCYS